MSSCKSFKIIGVVLYTFTTETDSAPSTAAVLFLPIYILMALEWCMI